MKFPLANYTHYSTGLSKPDELIARCSELNLQACGIADYLSVSGAVQFYKHAKAAGIKPILGCTFKNFRLFAKNTLGWKSLLHIVSSIDEDGNPNEEILNDSVSDGNLIKRNLSEDLESYYTKEEDQHIHKILVASKNKTTLKKVSYEYENMFLVCPENDLTDIYDSVEDINILKNPQLPRFPTPNNESEKEYLKELGRISWPKIVKNNLKKDIYLKRFLDEFAVIDEANLFGYFLIVQDIIKYAHSEGWITGPGRGSAAGCLISYLLGITQVDPIKYDLIFERFYNKGRNSADHISLPDIDIDVPAQKRDQIIAYIKNKYHPEHVSQMVTFGRLQGRSAIKEVLRVQEACSFTEMNEITKFIPDEAKISDQLEEMGDEKSIIMWSLINNAKDLKDFCFINHNGELEGDLAPYFNDAIRLEGTFKSQGKHAAGVVISKDKLIDLCPMVFQRDGKEKICGFEMEDLESCGLVKLDVLGLSLLDKIMYIKEI